MNLNAGTWTVIVKSNSNNSFSLNWNGSSNIRGIFGMDSMMQWSDANNNFIGYSNSLNSNTGTMYLGPGGRYEFVVTLSGNTNFGANSNYMYRAHSMNSL